MDPWLQIHGQQVDPLPEDLVDSVEIWSGGCFFFPFFENLNPKVGKMRKLLFQKGRYGLVLWRDAEDAETVS